MEEKVEKNEGLYDAKIKEILEEKNLADQKSNYFQELFYEIASKTYADFIKVELDTGDCARLIVENGQIVERAMNQNWNDLQKELLAQMIPDSRTHVENKLCSYVSKEMPAGKTFHLDYCCKKKDKKDDYIWQSLLIRIMEISKQKVAMLFWKDCTEEMQERLEIKEKLERDELTWLFNRTKLNEMLKTEYQNLKACGVLFFDVNEIRDVNHLYGRGSGDELICKAADSVRSLQNQDVSVYRWDDKFILIAKNYTKQDMEKLIRVWERLWEASIKDSRIPCSMSIGMACGQAPASVENLLEEANADMFNNKRLMKEGNPLLYIHRVFSDSLGLLNRTEFFQESDRRIELEQEKRYCLVAVDIEHFKLFNKWYGREDGDFFLKAIAAKLQKFEEEYSGVAGYCGGDNFAILLPDQTEILTKLQKDLCQTAMNIGKSVGFLPVFGIYRIEDRSMPAVAMYDLAVVALTHAFGNYEQRSYYYSADMTDKIEEELRLISEIKDALEQRQFTFYAQPKCRVSNGKVVGAEALVRWIHPTKGMIPPNVFIPVLEKNGFIGDLDRYVWEEVCRWLRNWIDKGYDPVPISINVSRIDILSMDVVRFLIKLTDKYNLERHLLKVEITESAYTENAEKIMSTIKHLRDEGFSILMDDFGSGYSSLNMLRSVIVDIIKIDMRFLDISGDEMEKGISILESVVNMSASMGVPVIVEGVETKKQEDYLLGMGCRYAQGYYYYRPMPIAEFEKIIAEEKNIDHRGIYSKKVEQLHLREFLDYTLFNDTLLNNILGPVAFYELYENDITIVRVNEQYYQMAGVTSESDAEYSKEIWRHLEGKDRGIVMKTFQEAYENPLTGSTDRMNFVRADGSKVRARIRMFFLREDQGRRLYFGILAKAWDEENDQIEGVLEKSNDKRR